DRGVDRAAARPGPTDDERPVAPFELPPSHERLQPPIDLVGARHDHQTGGVAVETVDGPRALPLVTAGHVVRQQTVHEGSAAVTRSGMNDDSRGLVDDQQVLVLVGDPDRGVLGDEWPAGVGRRFELELLTAGETVALRTR